MSGLSSDEYPNVAEPMLIDHREENRLSTRVIIVRHGQSTYNAQKRIQGRSDQSQLTPQGLDDAHKVAEALQSLPVNALYCSPLKRAHQTATVIGEGLPRSLEPMPDELLREIDLPLWENLTKQTVKTQFPEDYRRWQQQPQDFKMLVTTEQGPQDHYPVRVLYRQAQTFWQQLLPKQEDQTVVIVAHNGINRCLLMSAIGVPLARYHSIQQSNCGMSILNFTGAWGEAVQLESLNQTSHLGIALPPRRPPHQGLRLLLVRHGETQWNRESRFQGIKDIPLNEQGRQQGQKAATFLQGIPLNFAVSSPMSRPKETAEIILRPHPHISLDLQPDLVEICHGLWEGKLESEIEADFPGLLQQWKDAPETVQMPKGENLAQVAERAIACWQRLVRAYHQTETSQTGIVVAHDAINKVILCELFGLTPAHFWNIKQGNGAVSVIDYPEGSDYPPVLQAINLTNHLSTGILDQTAVGAL